MPRRQPKSVQNPCSEDATKSKPSQSKESGVHLLGGLTSGSVVGFATDFWAGLADFGGVVRRRAFCFRLRIFWRIFLLHFAT